MEKLTNAAPAREYFTTVIMKQREAFENWDGAPVAQSDSSSDESDEQETGSD